MRRQCSSGEWLVTSASNSAVASGEWRVTSRKSEVPLYGALCRILILATSHLPLVTVFRYALATRHLSLITVLRVWRRNHAAS